MAIKASKTSLGEFIRDNSTLTLTQSKVLAEKIIAHSTVEWTSGSEPQLPHITEGQLWEHLESGQTLQVTRVDIAPLGSTESAVVTWAPVSISWKSLDKEGVYGSVDPDVFVEQARMIEADTAEDQKVHQEA